MSGDFLHTLRPAPRLTLLLKAALLQGDPAVAAYGAWRRNLDLDAIAGPEFRILPLLSANLPRLGIRDPDQPRLQGIRRQELYRNRTRFHALGRTLANLGQKGIPVMLLKGAAICAAVRGDWSVRHMSDIDILVPADQAADAWAVFEADGWVHDLPQMARRRREYIRHFPNIPFLRPDGQVVELHWRPLWQRRHPRQEEAFWKESQEVDLDGLKVRVLSPTHQLLQVLAHAALSLSEPGPEWITDSFAILASKGREVDWEEFVRFTRERRICRTFAAQLHWLRTELGAPVPEEVVDRLSREKPDLLERSFAGVRIGRLGTLWLAAEIWSEPDGGSWWKRGHAIVEAWGWFHDAPPRRLPAVLFGKVARRLRGKRVNP